MKRIPTDIEHPRLHECWTDNPADPDRPSLDNPAVQELISEIAPGCTAEDLGGLMSLNVRLSPRNLVLRVHQPTVSRARVLAAQDVRRKLASVGIVVPVATAWRGNTVFRCGDRWAELEPYLHHSRQPSTVASYVWLFGAMGRLHKALAGLQARVPRPRIATYAPPGSLLRWLPVTEAAVARDSEASKVAACLHGLVSILRRRWVPAYCLPTHLVHGDVRLSNVCPAPDGNPVYLDFGFLAKRPRVHDIGYATAFALLGLRGSCQLRQFLTSEFAALLAAYEEAAGGRLDELEGRALIPYATSVLMYAAALDGFTGNPAENLRSRVPFLELAELLLDHLCEAEASSASAPH